MGEPVPPPAELDAEAAEFWDEHVEVDPVLAQRWWQAHAGRFTQAQRWQAGVAVVGWPVDAAVSLEAMRDVWLETCMRPGADAKSLAASDPGV